MADAQVRVLSTSLVQATTVTTAEQRIPLTPCDLRLILIGTIQKGLLFRKPPNPQIDQATFIHNLKSSFSRTLSLFYPLAGRLSADEHPDGTASVYIDCNNAGALFAHAVADGVAVADILEPLYVPPILWSFFALNWLRSYHGFSEPLFAVQVTELADGIFVGCTISHAVADGSTLWRFVNFWSQICRSGYSDEISRSDQTFTRHWFLDEKHLPIRIPWTMIRERVFHFTREKLADLKSQAQAESSTERISSLQTLISHIWRAVIRNRNNPDPDRETRFELAVGLRSRLEPKFPENYLGNAMVIRFVVLKERDLLLLEGEKGLGHVAAAVNRVVAGQGEEKMMEELEAWIENPRISGLARLAKETLLLSSSPRYDVYGNDFGWGKPVAVRSGAGNKFDGKVTVFTGVEAGSMDVEICLSPETLERLGGDQEFMAAVGV
ncbi:unnamed protein product [Linum tenue]|uniref:HXXXD-type acyl-transferase family protein n=1 Tax=Linum tenue TaxID=586396 RepID=A0AAV0JRD8_9ROSI|nr:unnamed protein product [Linum tenue]